MHFFLTVLFALMIWHALADFPWQGDFLSRAKNYYFPIRNVDWKTAMLMHRLIQAGGVWLITRSLFLAMLELFFHFVIDDLKCSGEITFRQDQFLHFVCKVVWAIVLLNSPMAEWPFWVRYML